MENFSELILGYLRKLDIFREADLVVGFVPRSGEPAVLPALKERILGERPVALVKTLPDFAMETRLWSGREEDLTPHPRYNLREISPSAPTTKLEDHAKSLILVPGLVFGADGKRVGNGGGYYDRFLAAHPSACRLGLCFSFQLQTGLTREAWDQNMDFILSDRGLLECPGRKSS